MSADRIFESFRRLVAELLRPTVFLGSYRYRVVDVSGGVAELQRAPLRPKTDGSDPAGLPDLARCPVWVGTPGGGGDPMLGSFALVRFIDGDKTAPYVESFEGESTPGYLPTRASLDASTDVVVGADASAVALGGAFSPVIRANEIVKFTGSFTDGNSFAAAATAGTLVIQIGPAEVLFGPGAPGTGYSRVAA